MTNTYQFFTRQKLSSNSSHVWGIGTSSSHVWGIGTSSSYPRKSRTSSSQVWRILTNSSYVRNYQAQILDPKIYRNWPYVNFTFGKCDVLVPVLLMCVKFTKWEIYGSTKPTGQNFCQRNLLSLSIILHFYTLILKANTCTLLSFMQTTHHVIRSMTWTSLLTPVYIEKKLGFTGVYIIFLISAPRHELWILVEIASIRQF